jgi:hypothetical protein
MAAFAACKIIQWHCKNSPPSFRLNSFKMSIMARQSGQAGIARGILVAFGAAFDIVPRMGAGHVFPTPVPAMDAGRINEPAFP